MMECPSFREQALPTRRANLLQLYPVSGLFKGHKATPLVSRAAHLEGYLRSTSKGRSSLLYTTVSISQRCIQITMPILKLFNQNIPSYKAILIISWCLILIGWLIRLDQAQAPHAGNLHFDRLRYVPSWAELEPLWSFSRSQANNTSPPPQDVRRRYRNSLIVQDSTNSPLLFTVTAAIA